MRREEEIERMQSRGSWKFNKGRDSRESKTFIQFVSLG